MDDIFCILKKGKESQLFDHLNGIRGEIQFTMESEKNRKLPFLDCDIMRNTDGSLTISIHRKSTHTDKYLHYNSHHPLHVRRGVVQCLFNRAEKLVATCSLLHHASFTLSLTQAGHTLLLSTCIERAALHPPQP